MENGTLFIVATPIGNLQDITIRAIKTLFSVEYILTEQKDKTSVFLTHIQNTYPEITEEKQKPKMISYNEFEEDQRLSEVIAWLSEGKDVALVSEAGTPLISDPGYKLVRECFKRNIKTIPIPGASSLITALSASPLPTDKFLFLGFLPKPLGKKGNYLLKVKSTLDQMNAQGLTPTVIFFESPHRISETLEIMRNVMGDIDIVLARELTKLYEEIVMEKISVFLKKFEETPPRGEYVLLLNTKT